MIRTISIVAMLMVIHDGTFWLAGCPDSTVGGTEVVLAIVVDVEVNTEVVMVTVEVVVGIVVMFVGCIIANTGSPGSANVSMQALAFRLKSDIGFHELLFSRNGSTLPRLHCFIRTLITVTFG